MDVLCRADSQQLLVGIHKVTKKQMSLEETEYVLELLELLASSDV
jgi:hypothetical protein